MAAPQANAFATITRILLGGQALEMMGHFLLIGIVIGVLAELLTGMGTAFGLGIFFILLARTRGAWIGLVAAGAFALSTGCLRGIGQLRRTQVLAVGTACAVVVLLAFVLRPSAEVRQTMGEAKATAAHAALHAADPSARLPMWRESLGITNPWLGAGFGNYPIAATPCTGEQRVKMLDWEAQAVAFLEYLRRRGFEVVSGKEQS